MEKSKNKKENDKIYVNLIEYYSFNCILPERYNDIYERMKISTK